MAANNDFLPFATGGSANVLGQSAYSTLPDRTNGFQSGVAKSANVNKAIRQASSIVAALSQLVCDQTGLSMNDDGNIAAQEANILALLQQVLFSSLPPVPFLTNGSFTYSVPSLITIMPALVLGAGGGGSGSDGNDCGPCGGAGGLALAYLTVVPGEQLDITVGKGGQGGGAGAVTANPGSNGGFSQIVRHSNSAVLLKATGGKGGGQGTSTFNGGAPGSGTVGPAGFFNFSGGWGSDGSGPGNNSTSISAAGLGGSSFLGGGGRCSTVASTALNGGQGAGGASPYVPPSAAGGNGGDGAVILFCKLF